MSVILHQISFPKVLYLKFYIIYVNGPSDLCLGREYEANSAPTKKQLSTDERKYTQIKDIYYVILAHMSREGR